MLISRQTAQTICRAGLAGEALRPLLDWAAAVVPRRARARTPVFLFGTAGLRRLSGAQQGELLRHARDTLSESPFRCNLEAQKHVKRCWRHTGIGLACQEWSATQKATAWTDPDCPTMHSASSPHQGRGWGE